MEDSAADLCSRCASIPWDHLERERKIHSSLWGDEMPTLEDLQSSSCRLCRLIASAILTLLAQRAGPKSLVTPAWERAHNIRDGRLGVVNLRDETGLFIGNLILATKESPEEDVMASFLVPKRADFSQVGPHLEACKASHKSCEPETPLQLLNLRVIDCIDNTVVVAPKGCSFVALSYVWGELCADSYVLGSHIAFPPTIEDAVGSTRKLGYQYLWVDRYCINQGDARDKEEQISQMGRIYASAQLTIVAAAGVDPSYGLAGISRDRKAVPAWEPVGSSRFLWYLTDATQGHIVRSPWFSRAWTLQEGFLSKRILCFTERDVVFTCKSCDSTMERGPDTPVNSVWNLPPSTRKVRTALSTQGKSLSDASEIMETYSERVRGHDSDALNAIVGILNVWGNSHPPVYHIWGVPFTITRRPDAAHSTDNTVSISLNWYHCYSGQRLPEFPSWSTLGWRGQVSKLSEQEVSSYFMIRYWSGDRYQELNNGTCNIDYTYSRDVTDQSQCLQVTTDIVQFELQIRPYGKFFKPTFIRRKQDRIQKEDRPDNNLEGPFLELHLDDETAFDAALPMLCATMTPLDIVSDSWISFQGKNPVFLVFQEKAKSYERIGACIPPVCTTEGVERRRKWMYETTQWEFVPPGEPGAWDQVAERRTFLLG